MIASNMDLILQKHGGARRDALIPILQEVQEACGHLSRDAIVRIGRHLNLPASKVYGVATFYNQFRCRRRGSRFGGRGLPKWQVAGGLKSRRAGAGRHRRRPMARQGQESRHSLGR